jgi:plasmid stabilization system protein ParE
MEQDELDELRGLLAGGCDHVPREGLDRAEKLARAFLAELEAVVPHPYSPDMSGALLSNGWVVVLFSYRSGDSYVISLRALPEHGNYNERCSPAVEEASVIITHAAPIAWWLDNMKAKLINSAPYSGDRLVDTLASISVMVKLTEE